MISTNMSCIDGSPHQLEYKPRPEQTEPEKNNQECVHHEHHGRQGQSGEGAKIYTTLRIIFVIPTTVPINNSILFYNK